MGRPPGPRLGRGQKHWSAQSWSEYDDRFEELETDDDALHGVGLDQGYRPKRFVSDELRFTGIDLAGGRAARRRRSYEDYSNSDDEDEYNGSTGLVRRGENQVMLREKEHVLVERALERIRRARALGKTDVKLEPSEIEALQRVGVIPRPPSNPAPIPKAPLKGKKAAQPKPKAIESKKSAKSSKSASGSPKVKAIEGRARGRSTASNRSKSDSKESKEDARVPYPVLPDDRYAYMYPPAYYARGSAPASRQQSQARTNSSQSLRQHPQPMPPYQHPYYQSRYYSNPDMYGSRPGSNGSHVSRPDPADPDWEPRARSSSSLVPYPLDQLPQAGGGKAPRFDPSDPRYASPPTRRIVSGPPAAQYRRQQDELFMPDDEPEVMQYLTNSSHDDDDEHDAETGDSDESGQGVQVDVEERSGGGYAIQTRAATAKGNGKAPSAKRRR